MRLIGLTVILTVGLTLAPFAAGPIFAAEGLAAYKPQQAVVFDGAPTAASTYFIAFSQAGLLLDLGSGPFVTCAGTSHISPGGVVAEVQGRGVFQSDQDLGVHLIPSFPAVFSELPAELKQAKNDCELLAAFSLVQAYLASVASQAQDRLGEVHACRHRVRALHCEVVQAIEQAPTVEEPPCPVTGCLVPNIAGPPGEEEDVGFVDFPPEACAEGVTALLQIPGLLDSLVTQVSNCQEAEAALQTLDGTVADKVASFGGLTAGQKNTFFSYADAILAAAEKYASQAEAVVASISALSASITLENLQASCAPCSGSTAGPVVIQANGAVLVQMQRQPIGRFVDAFEAAGFSDLSERLARVPNHRVLQFTYRSASAVGQDLVAVRAADAPDDGVSPLVVILSALPRDAPLPDMNVADQRLLFEGFRAFADVLGQRRN